MFHNFTDPGLREMYSNDVAGGNSRLQELHFLQTWLLFFTVWENKIIQYTWIILYTYSMASITSNELVVTYVCQSLADNVLAVMTNGGSQVFNKAVMLRISSFFYT